ncbi:MAG: hypothetical protein JWM89_2239 [Acidimicrobiales bacterium]|nr:hypothetical protein [Acidimicrobiales bacterium]
MHRSRIRIRIRAGRRPFAGALVALVAVVSIAAATTACEPARKPARNNPVLLVHGWSASGGTDCGGAFDRMIGQMKSEGFTGPFVKVGFYTGDSNCDMTLRDWGSFDNGSSWKDVAKAFSKYVSATYSTKAKTVDVVGYSMGGDIVRGAVYGSSIKESGFSAPIKVQDAVAFGSPFNGAAWYSSFCLWGQCSTMKPGATDIKWLNQNGNPQGDGGTEWTVFGSDADAVTPVDSALDMSVPDARKVRYPDVPHTGSDNYMGRNSIVTRADDALAKVDS